MTRTSNEEAFDELRVSMREIALEPPTLDGLESAIQRFYGIRDSILTKITDPEARRKVTWGISRAVFMEAIKREAPLEVCKKYLDLFAASGFGNEYFKWDYEEIYAVRCEEVDRKDEALNILRNLKSEIDLRMKEPLTDKELIGISRRQDQIVEKISALEN
jgi:hypothetical protein